ncbi:hypothetical protein FRB96_006992 [Tulasnella sp. 330]|nr:hypothetical protein FRB96_006992 [Tulasnella sp. 330]
MLDSTANSGIVTYYKEPAPAPLCTASGAIPTPKSTTSTEMQDMEADEACNNMAALSATSTILPEDAPIMPPQDSTTIPSTPPAPSSDPASTSGLSSTAIVTSVTLITAIALSIVAIWRGGRGILARA